MRSEAVAKERNPAIDALRGLAILMVILGHTISGCVVEYERTVVFNIIWSLQMPLFFLVSGYVSRYSKAITDWKDLESFVLKRTAAYMIPWFVWSFFVRGFVFGETAFLNIRYLLWHMDSGYWFLPSLWMMVLAFGLSQFVVSKAVKDDVRNFKACFLMLVCFGVIGVFLLAVGLMLGLSFLGIKLTVYYMPFYALGALVGRLQTNEKASIIFKNVDLITAVSCVIYFVLISRFDLFVMGESISEIGIRMLASLTGCAAICTVVAKMSVGEKWTWCGSHSLELYVVHYLLLCTVIPKKMPLAVSVEGFGLCLLNYSITVILTVLVVWMLRKNRILKKVLFWK